MNKKKLIALAQAKGFKGDINDIAAIKAFFASENIVLEDDAGKSIDLDAVWTKSVRVTVTTTEDDKENKDDPGDEDDSVSITGKDAAAYREYQKSIAEQKRAKGGGKVHSTLEEDDTPNGITRKAARRHYEGRIKTGQAVFGDIDHAEHFGAMTRLALVKMRGDFDYAEKANDLDIVGKTAMTNVNTAAGYLIPVEYVATLIYLTEKYGVARRIANVQRMSRDVQQRPRKTAIISMSHTGENTTPTAQDNTFGLVNLVASKVQANMIVTNEMLEDSAIGVADDLATSVAEAYAIRQDDDYFNGDGSATYGGFVGLTQALPGFGGTSGAYFNGAGSTWGTIVAADLDKMPGLVENVDVNRCCFVSSRQFYYQRVAALDTAASQFKALAGPGINGSDASYKGWAWYFSQKMQTTSASGKRTVYFGDFQAASMIGERRDLTIASSEHANFTNDAMTYRATARYAINIHGDGRGSTYGPIVALLTQ